MNARDSSLIGYVRDLVYISVPARRSEPRLGSTARDPVARTAALLSLIVAALGLYNDWKKAPFLTVGLPSKTLIVEADPGAKVMHHVELEFRNNGSEGFVTADTVVGELTTHRPGGYQQEPNAGQPPVVWQLPTHEPEWQSVTLGAQKAEKRLVTLGPIHEASVDSLTQDKEYRLTFSVGIEGREKPVLVGPRCFILGPSPQLKDSGTTQNSFDKLIREGSSGPVKLETCSSGFLSPPPR